MYQISRLKGGITWLGFGVLAGTDWLEVVLSGVKRQTLQPNIPE